MGRDKAVLPVPPAGQPLLGHVVTRLAPLRPGALVVVSNNAEHCQALVTLPGAPQIRGRCVPRHWNPGRHRHRVAPHG